MPTAISADGMISQLARADLRPIGDCATGV